MLSDLDLDFSLITKEQVMKEYAKLRKHPRCRRIEGLATLLRVNKTAFMEWAEYHYTAPKVYIVNARKGRWYGAYKIDNRFSMFGIDKMMNKEEALDLAQLYAGTFEHIIIRRVGYGE